jgi:hypothetical protein
MGCTSARTGALEKKRDPAHSWLLNTFPVLARVVAGANIVCRIKGIQGVSYQGGGKRWSSTESRIDGLNDSGKETSTGSSTGRQLASVELTKDGLPWESGRNRTGGNTHALLCVGDLN